MGTITRNIDLIVTLTGSLTSPNNATLTRNSADVYVMDAGDAEAMFSFGGNSVLLQNSLPTTNRTSIGLQPGNPLGIAAGAISFEVNPGDSFYLLANLGTLAFDMGTAVSMNSLSMTFTYESDLVSASSTVMPVAVAAGLFGAGLTGLIGLAQRKTWLTSNQKIVN